MTALPLRLGPECQRDGDLVAGVRVALVREPRDPGAVEAAVSELAELRGPYAILETQSFDVLDAELEVTDADEATGTVHAFNHRPAAEAYADALGCSVAELPGKCGPHPLGLVIAGEPFVRSPQQILGDDLVFYCQIKPGMKLRLLQTRDIRRRHRPRPPGQARRDRRLPGAGQLPLHRAHHRARAGRADRGRRARVRRDPDDWVSTCGESDIGHINQTSTMLLHGARRQA